VLKSCATPAALTVPQLIKNRVQRLTSEFQETNRMSTATVSIQLPDTLFRKLKRAADLTHRPLEEIVATSLEATLPSASGLPAEIADELAAMQVYSDAALQAAVEPSMSRAEQKRLEQLNAAAGERALTAAEKKEQQALITAYDRSVLRRAKAMAILAQRGHDVSAFLQAPDSDE
jgi:uncharacterized protein YnzC (UPF0291/DUF896 family)